MTGAFEEQKSRRKRRPLPSSSNPKDPDPLFFKMLKVAQVYFTVLPLAFASAIFFAPKEFMAA